MLKVSTCIVWFSLQEFAWLLYCWHQMIDFHSELLSGLTDAKIAVFLLQATEL